MSHPEVLYFETAGDLQEWFAENHDLAREQWIGFYKKNSGVKSIDWPESVDAALCFGWIDGLRKSVDDKRYRIRFTSRRPGSHWSARNLARMEELIDAGRVEPAGLAVYEDRDPTRERQASYEQSNVALPTVYENEIRATASAWEHWRQSPPSYRKQVSWWIISAKKEATRRKRLETLISSSAQGSVIPALRWSTRK